MEFVAQTITSQSEMSAASAYQKGTKSHNTPRLRDSQPLKQTVLISATHLTPPPINYTGKQTQTSSRNNKAQIL